MTNKIFTIILIFAITAISTNQMKAQVAINTDGTSPDAAAMLDVKSTDKGMLVPRMTSTQRTAISSLADGLLVYDTNTKSFWFYNNSAWSELVNDDNMSEIHDADNDTKIEVEKNADEDVVRFTTNGIEYFAMASGRLGVSNTGESVFIGYANAVMDDFTNNRNIAIGSWNSHINTTGEHNIALGYNSLRYNDGGNSNIAIGSNVISNNPDRSDLIAIGDSALYDNANGASLSYHGTQNTAIGSKVMKSNTRGFENTALGYQSMYSNTTGPFNTAVGSEALHSNTTGNNNTAMGTKALYTVSTGSQNTAVGKSALYLNTASFNTAIGSSALGNNTSGQYNTSVGTNSLTDNIDGYRNSAFGVNASANNTSGNDNIAIGNSALWYNETGSSNISIGNSSLKYVHNIDNLVAIGDSSLYINNGNSNTAVGSRTLRKNTSGSQNTAVGTFALYFNDSGDNNTTCGAYSLYNNTGNDNSAFGKEALNANTGGTGNTALGSESLILNTTGDYNTAVGYFSLGTNNNGKENTAVGGRTMTTGSGDGNVALGFEALRNTTSHYNTAIGYKAGDNITGGSRNIIIGNSIDAPSATSSYQMSIGNLIYGTNVNGTGTTYSSGNVGIGINNPVQKLDVRGNIQARNTSGTALIYIDGTSGNNELQFRESGSYAAGIGYNTASNYLYFYRGGNVVLRNGNLGIGVTNPGYRLQVGNAGDGSTARANAWNTFSDKRLKKDFEVIENPIEKIHQLSGYYYYWKEGEDQSRQVGVIAQEVEDVLPEIVSTDAEGVKSLDYSKITPLLIEVVKEQQQSIEMLNKRIEKLEQSK